MIDDATVYYNGQEKNFYQTVSLQNMTDDIQWACENGINTYLIADRPTISNPSKCYTQDLGYCTGDIDYEESYIPIVIDYLNQTTQNGLYANCVYLEESNEPYFYSSWYANNIAYDEISGALEYIRYFNLTTIHVKEDLPYNINVGGPSGFRNAPNLTTTFLSNMSLMKYPADFHSIHPYGYSDANGLEQYTDIQAYRDECDTYSVNCSHVVASEWAVGSSSLKNTSSNSIRYGNSILQSYVSLMNNLPSVVTSQIYQWSERFSYINRATNSSAYYPEYDSKWHTVLDPQFQSSDAGELTQIYNYTKYISELCPPNSNITNISYDNNSLSMTACQHGTTYSIISGVVNTSTINHTICAGQEYPYSNIINYITGENYTLSGTDKCLVVNQDSYQDSGISNNLFLSSAQAPTITSLSPTNNTYTNNATVNFSANLTDDVGLNNATLYIQNATDGSLITTIVNYVAGEKSVIQSWGLFNLVDGIYHWWISLWDDEFTNTISDNQTLYVNANNPVITILNPTASSTEALNPVLFKINLSERGSCLLGFNGVNYTMTGSGTTSFTYSLSVSDGDHTANFYCSDLTNNKTSSSVFFTFIPLGGTIGGGDTSSGGTGQVCVSLSQLNVLIGKWKQGSINLNTLNSYINKWKTREIC